MAELYNQVRQSNSKYIPKFVGSNFDTLKAVGDVLGDRYHKTKDYADALAIQMANDRNKIVNENDKAIIDKHYNNLSNIINEVSKSDDNFENSPQVISQAVKEYATDAQKLAVLENAERHREYLNAKAKLGTSGFDRTRKRNQNFFNYGTINPDGTINRFEHALELKKNYDEPKEKIWNDLKADLVNKGYYIDKTTGRIVDRNNRRIDEAKLNAYLNSAVNRYKTGFQGEYEQEKEFRTQNAEEQGINLSDKDLNNEIIDSILDVGREHLFNEDHISTDAINPYLAKRLYGDDEDQPKNPHEYEETQGIEYKPDLINLSKLRNQAGGRKTVGFLSNYSVPKGEEQFKLNNEEDAVKQYTRLSPEEKKKFDKIVKHFNGNINPNSLEGFKIVNDYIDNVKKNEVNEKTPIITSDYIRVGEDGRSTREDATKDLASNFSSRTFYNPQTGDKISGSDPDFLNKINKITGSDFKTIKEFKDNLDVRGEYSAKNLFTKFAGSDHFVDPLAVTVNGKDFAVTRPISNTKTNAYRTRKIVNDAYKALKETPGIENEVTIEGIPFSIGEYKDEENGGTMYVLQTQDGTRQVAVKDLEDLPKALQAEFSR